MLYLKLIEITYVGDSYIINSVFVTEPLKMSNFQIKKKKLFVFCKEEKDLPNRLANNQHLCYFITRKDLRQEFDILSTWGVDRYLF